MPSLRELQTQFAAAVLADTGDRGERIAIYRNTIFANYRNALGATYPVVLQLVGRPFFDAAVDAYVLTHPSTGGDLNVYGDRSRRFPGKLSAREGTSLLCPTSPGSSGRSTRLSVPQTTTARPHRSWQGSPPFRATKSRCNASRSTRRAASSPPTIRYCASGR